MPVRKFAQPGTLRQAFTTGEGDDFHARFILQMCQIRDCVIDREKRQEFDKIYRPVHQNLTEAKFAKDQCHKLIADHVASIASGQDGKYHGQQIDVMHPIDSELNMYFKDLFIRGEIACNALMAVARFLGFNLALFFSDSDKEYKKGLAKFPLKQDDDRFKTLSGMILGHKDAWYLQFRELRVKIEHHGWALPPLQYRLTTDQTVEVLLPAITPQGIEEVLKICWENLTSLCEEILVYLMSLKLRNEQIMVYIPPDKRDKLFPISYSVRHKDFPEARYSSG